MVLTLAAEWTQIESNPIPRNSQSFEAWLSLRVSVTASADTAPNPRKAILGFGRWAKNEKVITPKGPKEEKQKQHTHTHNRTPKNPSAARLPPNKPKSIPPGLGAALCNYGDSVPINCNNAIAVVIEWTFNDLQHSKVPDFALGIRATTSAARDVGAQVLGQFLLQPLQRVDGELRDELSPARR